MPDRLTRHSPLPHPEGQEWSNETWKTVARSKLPVAVIGAGFSGTMTALHLLQRLPPWGRVLLCERAPSFGKGTAYATREPAHLLNVRAANMSAFPDRPGHFEEWLRSLDPEMRHDEVLWTMAGTFASRRLYGRYLAALLAAAAKRPLDMLRLQFMPDDVIDLEPCLGGYRLVLEGGRTHTVAGAVLAVGNLRAGAPASPVYQPDPWRPDALARLDSGRPVVILGTGLTMVDLALRLGRQNFTGGIMAISRRGLLPHWHEPVSPRPVPDLSEAERTSLPRLLRRLRDEVERAAQEGQDWRSVVDGLRPVTAELWRALPPAERRRFLRHARPWWDVHRHRMAPPAADEIRRLMATGRLAIRAGRVQEIATDGRQALVRFRPRGRGTIEIVSAQRVIDATGTANVCQTRDPLIGNLLARGLVRADSERLGIEVTDRLEVVGRNSAVSPGLWALGPIVRGVFWECTSVPDIRTQAVLVAETAASSVAGADF